jgi:hypothetical protein
MTSGSIAASGGIVVTATAFGGGHHEPTVARSTDLGAQRREHFSA